MTDINWLMISIMSNNRITNWIIRVSAVSRVGKYLLFLQWIPRCVWLIVNSIIMICTLPY